MHKHLLKELTVKDAKALLAASGEISVIDIRQEEDFQQGHLPHAKHLTPANFEDFLNTTEKNEKILCYCYHGISSVGLCETLLENGYTNVYNLAGGFEAWKRADS